MTNLNEQFQKFWDYQTGLAAPMRTFGTIAAETFERVARQNQAVLGDCIDFAVEQVKLATQVTDVTEYSGKQLAHTQSFGEKIARRVHEYAEIAQAAQARTQNIAASSTAETRRDRKVA
jgi:hypothetical protein